MHLHVNQKSDYDDDESYHNYLTNKNKLWINTFLEEQAFRWYIWYICVIYLLRYQDFNLGVIVNFSENVSNGGRRPRTYGYFINT